MSDITYKWVELLMPFTSGYSLRFTETELAKMSKVPQQSASRYLTVLTQQNILSYEIKGRNKFFHFDLGKQTTFTILQIIENFKTLKFLQNEISASVLINELLKYSKSIILFGSYASQKHDEQSDIDLIIVGKSDKKQIRKIKRNQVIQINEQYITYSELTQLLRNKNPLVLEIQKNHVLFGDASKTVSVMLEAKL